MSNGNGRYHSLEETGRADRALYKIRPLAVALLLRISAGEPRQDGDVASAVSLAGRGLVKPFANGHAGAYELTPLGVESVAQIKARAAAGMGLAKRKPPTAIERGILHSIGAVWPPGLQTRRTA